ncbi:MAG: glycosyltransferase family 2 protein [Bacilli bacterium]|nr:glycosyltransferase family 2 protein [Bacilli bacterium]
MTDISVIIPVYNGEKYIRKCLDSVINQTKKEIEIVVVNDGSTDNTESIIKEYKDKRIKYFKNTNHGIGYSRNFGVSKSSGKYIMFLDSDDYIDKDECKLLYEKCLEDDLDISICDFYKVYNNDLIEVNLGDFKSSSLKDNPDIITEFLNPWGKLYNKKILTDNKIKFVENLKYEDAPFVIETFCNAKKIGKVNKALHYYVIHGNSETTVRDEKCFDILKIVDKIRKYTKDKEYLKDKIDKLTVRILTNYTIQQRMQKNKKIGMKFIDEAFSYLKKEVPDYKNNKYYENRGMKKIIEKNKLLTKIYCRLYK